MLPCIDLSDVSDLLLFNVESAEVSQLLLGLELLDFITVVFEDIATTLQSAHVIFDGVVRSYPKMESRIRTEAGIIHNVNFENSLVKIQLSIESRINEFGERTVSHPLKPSHAVKVSATVDKSTPTKFWS